MRACQAAAYADRHVLVTVCAHSGCHGVAGRWRDVIADCRLYPLELRSIRVQAVCTGAAVCRSKGTHSSGRRAADNGRVDGSWRRRLELSQLWVQLALGLFALAFLVGALYMSRLGIILLAGLWDMVFKPGMV